MSIIQFLFLYQSNMEKRLVCKPKQRKFIRQRSRIEGQPFSMFFRNRAVKLTNIQNISRFSKHLSFVNLDSKKTKQIKKKPVKITINQLNSFKINQILKKELKVITNDNITKASNKFSREVIDILYRYRAPNYNPYLNTLQLTYKQPDLVQKQKIRQLCFIGLAKSAIRKKSYGKHPSYGQTNILTRTYMLGMMKQQIQNRQQENDKAIYVPIQDTALSFNYKEYPSKLLGVVSQPNYQSIIKNVNKIIEKQYIRYKKGSSINHIELTKSEIGTVLVTIMLFIAFVLTKNIILAYSIPIIVFLGFVLSAYQCRNKLNTLHATKDVCESIKKQIKMYFNSINTPFLQFKVGTDFYWLQINYKHKKTPYMFKESTDRPRKTKQRPKKKSDNPDGYSQYQED